MFLMERPSFGYFIPDEVHIGDSISYDVSVFNGIGSGPVVCDATGITASLTTPDGVVHPLTLLRTSLANNETDTYSNVVTYVARAEDVIGGNTLTATAMDTGTIHQNDTDSQGGANQGVNTSVAPTPPVIPPTVPPVTPPHSTSSGGGGCAYGFNFQLSRCNYTPVIPVPESTPVAMPAVIVSATPFPGAGFGPQGRSFPWYIFLLSGVAVVTLVAGKKVYTHVFVNK
jgi:hypothetical protein